MALPSDVLGTDTFEAWRLKTNQIKDNVLDKTLNFSDVVSAATARQNLGLEIGVDIQGFVKNKIDGAVAPTANEDSIDGYSVGSLWIDVTADEAYRCLDASVGAAVWVNTTLSISELGSMALAETTNYYTKSEVDTQTATVNESAIAMAIALG